MLTRAGTCVLFYFPVVDAYTKWCGPCTALNSFFKKVKTDYSDPQLHFATVEVRQAKHTHTHTQPWERVFVHTHFHWRIVLAGADSALKFCALGRRQLLPALLPACCLATARLWDALS